MIQRKESMEKNKGKEKEIKIKMNTNKEKLAGWLLPTEALHSERLTVETG